MAAYRADRVCRLSQGQAESGRGWSPPSLSSSEEEAAGEDKGTGDGVASSSLGDARSIVKVSEAVTEQGRE